MAIYTYTGNKDPAEHTGQISLRNGSLLLNMGSYADLTSDEVTMLSPRFILEAGIVGGAPVQSPDYSVPGYGTLANRPSIAGAHVPDRYIYFATDEEGGTAYQAQAGQWVRFSPGLTQVGRGSLGSSKVSAALSSGVLAGNAVWDVPGMTRTFTYQGRPVKFSMRMPWSKFSIGSTLLQIGLRDVATNKEVYREGVVSPADGNAFFSCVCESDPISAMADGTMLITGTSYTFKTIIIPAVGGTLTTSWAANTGFYGHLTAFEV